MSDDVETKYVVYWLSNDRVGADRYRSFIYNNLETAKEAAKSFAQDKPGTMFHVAVHMTTFLAETVTVLKEI